MFTTSPVGSIWLEMSINWHTTSQGTKKISIKLTKQIIDPCLAHTARNKGSFTTMVLWIVQRFLSSTVYYYKCTLRYLIRKVVRDILSLRKNRKKCRSWDNGLKFMIHGFQLRISYLPYSRCIRVTRWWYSNSIDKFQLSICFFSREKERGTLSKAATTRSIFERMKTRIEWKFRQLPNISSLKKGKHFHWASILCNERLKDLVCRF